MQTNTPRTPSTRSRPSLYRTVLSLAVAALVAVSLPFSVFYASAVNKYTAATAISTPASQSTGAQGGSRPVVITTASGATRIVPTTGSGAGGAGNAAAVSVITRSDT